MDGLLYVTAWFLVFFALAGGLILAGSKVLRWMRPDRALQPPRPQPFKDDATGERAADRRLPYTNALSGPTDRRRLRSL